MAKGPREIELKFALPAARLAEVLAALPALGDVAPRALTSTYFDTPRRSLLRALMVLRVRRDGDSFVQTLKDSGDGMMSRGEWETEVSGPVPAPGRLAKTPAARILRKGSRLSPQFTVEVVRRSAVTEEDGSRIEISLDEGEIRAAGKRAAFAELELELKDGPIRGLLTLARKIAPNADLTLSFTSKAERGFALAARSGVRALKFEPPALTGELTAGEAFQAVARATLRQVVGNAERLRRRAGPEVIHQLRVGLRRMRSLVTTFKAVVADARLPALKAELEWLTGELDAARNLDVLLAGDYRAAVARTDNAEGLKGLGARLRGARRIAYARAAAAAESERFRRLVLDLLVWIEAGPWLDDEALKAARNRPVVRFATKALRRRRRKVEDHGRHVACLAPEKRHKLRIDAKKLRYAAEVFAGLYDHPKRARRFIDALKAVQDGLGELNDMVVGEALTQDVVAGGARGPAGVAAAAKIAGVRQAREAELLAKAQESLDALGRAKTFW